ncbi:MAG: hypothetical protein AAFW47_08890, partial [Pseudomonadota bacterium]
LRVEDRLLMTLRPIIIVCLALVFLSVDGPSSFYGNGPEVTAQEKKSGFFERLFSIGRKKKPQRAVRPADVKPQKQRKASTSQKRKKKKASTAALPKHDDANRIVVIGDVTAEAIVKGLTSSYRRTPAVEISPRVDPDISVVGTDFYPWLDASDFGFLGDRVKAVVVALGMHDRANIQGSSGEFQFNSAGWRRQYNRRLIDVAAQLQLLSVPVIWVLPPPAIDNDTTKQALAIGQLQKTTFEPFNFRIVDATLGFTSDEVEYRQSGASLSGSRVLLRLNDGIGFTRKGANKIAHYVRTEIDQILDDSVTKDFQLEADAPRRRSASQKVVILTRPALRQGETLRGGNGRVSAFYRDARARAYFVDGQALSPPKGRVDYFAWPEDTPAKVSNDKAAALQE